MKTVTGGVRLAAVGVLALLLTTPVFAVPRNRGKKEEAVSEAHIRQRVEAYAKAVRERDVDRVMSYFAPDIVSFDINPPLRYGGSGNKRNAWQAVFKAYPGPLGYEVHELSVTANGDLAFVHALNHIHGKLASGHASDMWVRWTACFQRIDGVWLITHDHVSVPADLEHGKAMTGLTP